MDFCFRVSKQEELAASGFRKRIFVVNCKMFFSHFLNKGAREILMYASRAALRLDDEPRNSGRRFRGKKRSRVFYSDMVAIESIPKEVFHFLSS